MCSESGSFQHWTAYRGHLLLPIEWKQPPFLKRHGVAQCPALSGILFQDDDLRVALCLQAVDAWADAKLGASRRKWFSRNHSESTGIQ